MAQKDYVKRGRTQKKPAPPAKAPMPWLRIFIILSLIAGFTYFLFSIKDRAETEESVVSTDKAEEEALTLPDIPEEQWEFFKLLPTQSVTIEDKEQALSDKRYLMQCGSFRKYAQAEQMKAKMAFQGLEAQIRESNGKNGLWHRVLLGPYELKRVAEKDRHTLERAGIKTCRIWYWDLD